MSLTPSQLAALKADILASSDMNAQPMNSGGAYAIAALYNQTSTTDVWRTDASVNAIYDAIDWTKFTPSDAADNTTTYTNRVLLIQTKQINLQNMLQGRSTVDASRPNLRAGMRDAVTGLPSGASGAAISAGGTGGATVLAAMIRKATRYEKLFSTTTATTGPTTANVLILEGTVSSDDIQQARES